MTQNATQFVDMDGVFDQTDAIKFDASVVNDVEVDISQLRHDVESSHDAIGVNGNSGGYVDLKDISDVDDDDDDDAYFMRHGRRGLALIFNHYKFDLGLGLDPRTGTRLDRESLRSSLYLLGFDVQVRSISRLAILACNYKTT